MNVKNKRDLSEFKSTTEIFLKANYYLFIQHYLINFIIKSDLFHNFLSSVKNKFSLTISSVTNLSINEQNDDLIKYLKFASVKNLNIILEKINQKN